MFNQCCCFAAVDFYYLYFKESTMNAIVNFMKDEDGLTAIEYVIAAALLVAGLTILFQGYGQALADKLQEVLDSIDTTPPAA